MSDWERSRWLQMWDGDGVLWMETSSPREVRTQVRQHPEWPVFRLCKCGEEYERRPITLEELEADCVAEAEWYRRARGGSNP